MNIAVVCILLTATPLLTNLCFRHLYFDVEPTTGAVYVKNETLLDREVRSLYSATLQARDTGGKPGTTVLEITLTDINDQAPVFNRESYLEFVPEDGQFELQITVTLREQFIFPMSVVLMPKFPV